MRHKRRRKAKRARSGDMPPGVVGAAHQGAGLNVAKAQPPGLLAEGRKLVGMDIAFNRELICRRPQVLAKGQDVTADRAQIAKHGQEYTCSPLQEVTNSG